MDDQVSAVSMTNNLIESDGSGIFLCHGCPANSAGNHVVVLQPAAFYDRGPNGVTYSTGHMIDNDITRVDLLPSYFPANFAATTIVVQLSGQASGGTNAVFNAQVDGAIIGTGTAGSNIADYIFTVPLVPQQVHRIAIGLTNGANT
jgi:Ca-dependent carbohydrate-binding module xylan-binding